MGGQESRDRIVAELGKLGDASSQGVAAGGFAFTESDIRKVIANWVGIVESYDSSLAEAAFATQIDGPGLDFASNSFASKANESGTSLVQHLRYGREYSIYQAQLAQNALDDYLGVEHTNVMDFNKTQQGSRPEV